jgi:pSer/pThr/pTyr-binding forkhead associated (FHA) protein
MAFLVVEKGPADDLGKTFVLESNPMIIGRSGAGVNPDIALNDPYVSRRHVEVSFDQGRYTVRDLGSTNGTLIDDAKAEAGAAHRLLDNTLIGLGILKGVARVSLRFKDMTTLIGVSMRVEPVKASPATWLSINRDRQEIWIDGKRTDVSRKEYDLLCYLEANTGRLCRKDELAANVWPEVANTDAVSDAAIDQLVHRLRMKTEQDPARPTRIISRKGFGYMLVNS